MPAQSPFKMPTHYSIQSLSASVTKAFVMAILPRVVPLAADVEEALGVLGMADHAVCAYCGDKQTQWDHFRPVVTDSMPTGYISEIQNLVPCCGPCNSSKGAQQWQTWMTGPAKRSPASRRVVDLDARVQRLVAFEQWRRPTVVDFETLLGAEEWRRYWDDWATVKASLVDAQPRATTFKPILQQAVGGATSAAAPPAHGIVVHSPRSVTAPLSKRKAVLAMVLEAQQLVPCAALLDVLGPSRFRSVRGTLSGDVLWAALAHEHSLEPSKRPHWFVESPLHEDDRTWVLQGNVWGPKTTMTLDGLAGLTGGAVTWAPVGGGPDSID